ncbi:MAG: hypothetical protein V1744_06000 [Candidatus Altiarchaeota archaeon]
MTIATATKGEKPTKEVEDIMLFQTKKRLLPDYVISGLREAVVGNPSIKLRGILNEFDSLESKGLDLSRFPKEAQHLVILASKHISSDPILEKKPEIARDIMREALPATLKALVESEAEIDLGNIKTNWSTLSNLANRIEPTKARAVLTFDLPAKLRDGGADINLKAIWADAVASRTEEMRKIQHQ